MRHTHAVERLIVAAIAGLIVALAVPGLLRRAHTSEATAAAIRLLRALHPAAPADASSCGRDIDWGSSNLISPDMSANGLTVRPCPATSQQPASR